MDCTAPTMEESFASLGETIGPLYCILRVVSKGPLSCSLFWGWVLNWIALEPSLYAGRTIFAILDPCPNSSTFDSNLQDRIYIMTTYLNKSAFGPAQFGHHLWMFLFRTDRFFLRLDAVLLLTTRNPRAMEALTDHFCTIHSVLLMIHQWVTPYFKIFEIWRPRWDGRHL